MARSIEYAYGHEDACEYPEERQNASKQEENAKLT